MDRVDTLETQKQATASNPSATDVDEEIETKLRGDAIGDTLYSQTFVAKTLLRLSDGEWNAKLEEDLCSLWDMTVEKDVCAYLFELSYPDIAGVVIRTYTEERLIEIIVGILANIFCASCSKGISADNINTVLQVLNTDDSLILIQALRFIKALAHFDNCLKFLNTDVFNRLMFILANSLNTPLLLGCLETVASFFSYEAFPKNYLTPQLYDCCLTAYKTIVSKQDEDVLFESTETQNAFTRLLTIITGFTSYIDENQETELLSKITNKNDSLLTEVKKLLRFYASDFNLIPVTETFQFFIQSFGYNFPILRIGYDSDVFKEVVKIVLILIENKCLETEDFSELLCYLVNSADLETLKNDVDELKRNDVIMVLEKFRGTLGACETEICKEVFNV